MLNRDKEWVPGHVPGPAAPGIVLDLDDDCLELTYLFIEQKRPEKRKIVAVFPLVTDKDRHDTSRSDSF